MTRTARLLPLLTAALLACGGGTPAGAPAPDAEAAVEVENLGFADVTVYAISATGARVRLGQVSGNSTQRLTVPAHLVRGGERLRFLADPIGGSQGPVSEELYVAPGETVGLMIPPR
jgi:hypothetical protein